MCCSYRRKRLLWVPNILSSEAHLLLQEYSKFKIVEFSEELEFLEKWAIDQSQSCLLVTGEPRSGKKTLLYEWLKREKEVHSNWIFIPQFSSVTPTYNNILYKIMVELRVSVLLFRIILKSNKRLTSIKRNSGGTSSIGLMLLPISSKRNISGMTSRKSPRSSSLSKALTSVWILRETQFNHNSGCLQKFHRISSLSWLVVTTMLNWLWIVEYWGIRWAPKRRRRSLLILVRRSKNWVNKTKKFLFSTLTLSMRWSKPSQIWVFLALSKTYSRNT